MAYDGFYPGLTTRASVNEILNTAIQAKKDIEEAAEDTMEALDTAKVEIAALGQGIEQQVQRVEQLATQTSQSAGRAELAAQTATVKASESEASAVRSKASETESGAQAVIAKGQADHAKTDADYVRAVAVKGLVEEAPNDGFDYLRKSKQWVKSVKEVQYYDVNLYFPDTQIVPGNGGQTVAQFSPRVALKGAVLEGCYLRRSASQTGNLTLTLKDSSNTWTCTGSIPSGAVEGTFTGTPGPVSASSLIQLNVGSLPGGAAPKDLTITLRFEVAAVNAASFP